MMRPWASYRAPTGRYGRPTGEACTGTARGYGLARGYGTAYAMGGYRLTAHPPPPCTPDKSTCPWWTR